MRALAKDHFFNSNDHDMFTPEVAINVLYGDAFKRVAIEFDDQILNYNKFSEPTARQCECWDEELLAESTMIYTAAHCSTKGSNCTDGDWDEKLRNRVQSKCPNSRVVDDWRTTWGYGVAQYREGAKDKWHWSNLVTDYMHRREARFHDRGEFVMLDVERYKRGNRLHPDAKKILDSSRLNLQNLK